MFVVHPEPGWSARNNSKEALASPLAVKSSFVVTKEDSLITKEPSLVIKEVKSMKRQLASCIRLALQIAFRFFNLQKNRHFFSTDFQVIFTFYQNNFLARGQLKEDAEDGI